ncbi:MAG: hypothetical protein HUJ51_04315 [Eggerthellaceae bacterium]|nr:hypothetical protein [Eggerthellaceae bacterium]
MLPAPELIKTAHNLGRLGLPASFGTAGASFFIAEGNETQIVMDRIFGVYL